MPEGGTNGPPIIAVNGDNPATIGDQHADLGAILACQELPSGASFFSEQQTVNIIPGFQEK
jgi:hypothetical protein